jgi:hypothetical protein
MIGSEALAPVAPAPSSLMVFALVSPWVFALPAASVERLILPEEGRLEEDDAAVGAGLGLLRVGRVSYAAFDLGLLLGLPAQSEAWILLRLPGPQGPLPLALRTGPCLSAGPLPRATMAGLPEALLRARPRLFAGAFPAPQRARAGRDMGAIGLALDLGHLWTEAELLEAEGRLRAASVDVA